jgi:high-affinity K+ transport system ATPase subunit B
MIIELKKFGTTLTSRQTGKEALAAFQPALESVSDAEEVVIDFTGVITFTPSWADEFITPLHKRYADRMILKNTANSSVQATLKLLEDIGKIKFKL